MKLKRLLCALLMLPSLAFGGAVQISKVGHTGDFGDLLNKPTTLAGYGITDAIGNGPVIALTGDATHYAGLRLTDGVQPVYNYILSTGSTTSDGDGYSRIFLGSNVYENASGVRVQVDTSKPYTFWEMENNWLNGIGSQRQNEINWTSSDVGGQERRAFNWTHRTDNREIGGFGFFFPLTINPSAAYYSSAVADGNSNANWALDIQYPVPSGDASGIRIWNTHATSGSVTLRLTDANNDWWLYTDRAQNGSKSIGMYDQLNGFATVMQFNSAYALTLGGTVKPTGYLSSDGTAGASATTGGLTFKNGLYTSGTSSTAFASLTDTGDFTLSGTLTPTALSANTNNYNPTGLSTATALRLDGGASDYNITGLSGGADGRIITIRTTR